MLSWIDTDMRYKDNEMGTRIQQILYI